MVIVYVYIYVCVSFYFFSFSLVLSYGFRLVHTMTTAMSDDVISNSVQLGFVEKKCLLSLSLAIEMLILKEEIVQ